MKKITSLALALALALTLTACGKKDNTAGSGDSSVPADATALLTAVWTLTPTMRSSPLPAATMKIPWRTPPAP